MDKSQCVNISRLPTKLYAHDDWPDKIGTNQPQLNRIEYAFYAWKKKKLVVISKWCFWANGKSIQWPWVAFQLRAYQHYSFVN